MSKFLSVLAIVFLNLCSAYAIGLDFLSNDEEDSMNGEERLIIPLFLGTGTTGINLTTLAALLALAAAALLPLLALAALGLLLWALLAQTKDQGGSYGYSSGGYGGSGGHSSYSSGYRRFQDISDLEWETLSIMDWIQVGEEAWNKFDPADTDCQKKVICELYQNTVAFGPVAGTVTKYLDYLKYAEVLSLPDQVKYFVQELLDAASRGKSLSKDCGEMFSNCLFSVKSIMEKYGHIAPNEV